MFINGIKNTCHTIGKHLRNCMKRNDVSTNFTRLNHGWNADPNGPEPQVEWYGQNLRLTFYMNYFQFSKFSEKDIGEITFTKCSRFRIGSLNDEGWYRGQSRFKGVNHQWGEFYKIEGDLRSNKAQNDWQIRDDKSTGLNRFLFYFRDEDFECDARSWTLNIIKAK